MKAHDIYIRLRAIAEKHYEAHERLQAFAEWIESEFNHETDELPQEHVDQFSEPVHEWFGLSYAEYLTIPRTALQSMPNQWQNKFVQCLEELDETIEWRPEYGCYWVQLKDNKGRKMSDHMADYERGRRRLPLKVI